MDWKRSDTPGCVSLSFVILTNGISHRKVIILDLPAQINGYFGKNTFTEPVGCFKIRPFVPSRELGIDDSILFS